MAAPDYVPTDPAQKLRGYSSPPRRPDSWIADRPGELSGPQPSGPALGVAGPDQGFALKLARRFEDRLHLGGVGYDDAVAGCVAVAMKRSALFGRAPMIHDLTVGFTIYGFLDPQPPAELADTRRRLFAEIDSHHHYFERREVVDRVSEDWLRKPHAAVIDQYESDWTVFFTD